MTDKFLDNMTEEERDEYHAELFGITVEEWKEEKQKCYQK